MFLVRSRSFIRYSVIEVDSDSLGRAGSRRARHFGGTRASQAVMLNGEAIWKNSPRIIAEGGMPNIW